MKFLMFVSGLVSVVVIAQRMPPDAVGVVVGVVVGIVASVPMSLLLVALLRRESAGRGR